VLFIGCKGKTNASEDILNIYKGQNLNNYNVEYFRAPVYQKNFMVRKNLAIDDIFILYSTFATNAM
jgi:hypothetical protein